MLGNASTLDSSVDVKSACEVDVRMGLVARRELDEGMAHGVLDYYKVPLVFERNAQVAQERFGWLPHHHRAE